MRIAASLLVVGAGISILKSAVPAWAQGTDFRHDTNAPITWDAGRAEVLDREGRAILSGGVVARQAELTLRASQVTLAYSRESGVNVSRIAATGGVLITRPNQRAEGQTAIYDLDQKLITLLGRVSLTTTDGTVTGGRLVLDLRSGRAVMDGGTPGAPGSAAPTTGRVRGTFTVPQRR